MTLRQALAGDTQRLHELLEEMLDREDVVILLFDGDRAVNYIAGFGLSASQHELMALDIERVVRTAGATVAPRHTGKEIQRNRRKAAEALNISTVTLWRKMKQFGLSS